MKISQYIQDLEQCKFKPMKAGSKSFKDSMLESVDIWSNEACKGYTIRAGRRSGLSEEQIKELVQQLHFAFDDLTIEEAEEIYDRF